MAGETLDVSADSTALTSDLAPRVAIAAGAATLLLLALLHVLSPEFDPSWRMVSEYALGRYGVVLSLMFLCWAASSWALAVTLWPATPTLRGRIGLILLATSGLGEAMASVFDIRHALHGASALIGIPTLPAAAMLISLGLARSEALRPARKPLLYAANLTWLSLVSMAAAFAILITTFNQAGGVAPADGFLTELPKGVIALVGWANRFLIIAYCAWLMTVAAFAIRLRAR